MLDPIGRKKGKGISSEDRRKGNDSLRNAKLPEVKKSKPDVHTEATNVTGRNSGGTAGGETQNGGKRFSNHHDYWWHRQPSLTTYPLQGLQAEFLSKQEKGQPFDSKWDRLVVSYEPVSGGETEGVNADTEGRWRQIRSVIE